jgi:hypothetical protein
VLDYDGVPDMSAEAAWNMLVAGAKDKNLDDVKVVSSRYESVHAAVSDTS